jgi:P-type Cu+ transporter
MHRYLPRGLRIYLEENGRPIGLLAAGDPIKTTTADALLALRTAGARVILATGNGLTAANSVERGLPSMSCMAS